MIIFDPEDLKILNNTIQLFNLCVLEVNPVRLAAHIGKPQNFTHPAASLSGFAS